MAAALSFSAPTAHAIVGLSDFSTDQTLTQIGVGSTTNTAGSVGDPHIIGGYRDVTTRITGIKGPGVARSDIYVGDTYGGVFQQDLSTISYALTTVIWDGSALVSSDTTGDGTATPVAFSLGLDLTEGGINERLRVVGYNDGPAARGRLIVTVYETASSYATLALGMLGDSINQYDFIFDNFTYVGGFTKADFANVGALKLEIDARNLPANGAPGAPAGLDVILDEFVALNGVPEPMSASLSILALSGVALSVLRRRN